MKRIALVLALLLSVTSFAGRVEYPSAVTSPADSLAIAGRTTVDFDAIIQEHVDWVRLTFPDDDELEDVSKHRYILDNLDPIKVDSDMLETFIGLQECAMRNFPEYDEFRGSVSFSELKWYVFSEGWFLNPNSHKGYQIKGVVLAGRHVGIEINFISNGETITHELVHVLYPTFQHEEEFWNIHNKCWREVWYRGEKR